MVERGGSSATGRHMVKTADWTCQDCNTLNFAKRHRCNKCGNIKPKSLANRLTESEGTDPPPLRKGDWLCTGCQNVNWARRDKCNICFTPKPALLDQEDVQRTGRAGGHNDLQDPDDRVEHNSDDEEFDEYGRKKRMRRNAPVSGESRSVVAEQKMDDRQRLLERAQAEGVKLSYPPAPVSESSDEEDSQSSLATPAHRQRSMRA